MRSLSDLDAHPNPPGKPPFADRVGYKLLLADDDRGLVADTSLSRATWTSSTGPPAQTAYCSGAATNRWWHAWEQK